MPSSDNRFARQNCFGPPPEFPLASSWPGIVHHLSGTNMSAQGTCRLQATSYQQAGTSGRVLTRPGLATPHLHGCRPKAPCSSGDKWFVPTGYTRGKRELTSVHFCMTFSTHDLDQGSALRALKAPFLTFISPMGLDKCPLTCTHVRLLGPCFKTGRMVH